MESYRCRGTDPYGYCWVLEQLPQAKAKDIGDHTPKAYAQKLKQHTA